MKTVVIEAEPVNARFSLVMYGLALPAMPLAEVVSGYSFALLPDGRWVHESERAVLEVEVDPEGVRLRARVPGVGVAGAEVPPDTAVTLAPGAEIRHPDGVIRFMDPGEPYAGLLLADTELRLGVGDETTAGLGREPDHPGLAFPDRRGQGNLRWCEGERAERAREGGFTLDRALAGRRQASIRLEGDDLRLQPLHERCTTWVLRAGAENLERVDGEVSIGLGDRVVAGTTVVAVELP